MLQTRVPKAHVKTQAKPCRLSVLPFDSCLLVDAAVRACPRVPDWFRAAGAPRSISGCVPSCGSLPFTRSARFRSFCSLYRSAFLALERRRVFDGAAPRLVDGGNGGRPGCADAATRSLSSDPSRLGTLGMVGPRLAESARELAECDEPGIGASGIVGLVGVPSRRFGGHCF